MEQIKKYGTEIILGCLVISSVFIWHAVYRESVNDTLTIAFMNVGQGDAIFIESPTKNRIIIDGGPNAAIVGEVGKLVPWYSRWIDLLLVTHPDADHFAGFIDLLKRYQTGAVIESAVESDSKVYKQFNTITDVSGATRTFAMRGMIIDIGGGAYLDILFPDRDVSKMDTNDASIVAKLVYGSTTVMLTGDSPSKIEKQLIVSDGKNLQSTILKVGHHGSKTSTSEEFVEQVNPEYAIISAGKNNRYGHPTQEVLDVLTKADIEILQTAQLGTIIFESDGKEFIRK
jgi:competence protein ComEC